MNSKSGREVQYFVTPEDGKICEYTIDELMNFLDIRDIQVAKTGNRKVYCGRNTKKKGSVPTHLIGFTALNRKRLKDYYELETIIGGWKKGHRQKALRILAETMFRLKHLYPEIKKEVLKSAGKCCPPFPSEPGESIETIFKSLNLTKLISNEKLLKWLGVSTEIILVHRNQLDTIMPSVILREQKRIRKKRKAESTRKSRELKREVVLEILKNNPKASFRSIEIMMKKEHGLSVSRESIRSFVKALKLQALSSHAS
jgi:hypothetical protein